MFIVATESASMTPSEGLISCTVKLSGSSVMLSALMRRVTVYSVLPAEMDVVVFLGS